MSTASEVKISLHRGEATEPYKSYPGKSALQRKNWTYYYRQDKVNANDLYRGWPGKLREVGPIMIPERAEASLRQEHLMCLFIEDGHFGGRMSSKPH